MLKEEEEEEEEYAKILSFIDSNIIQRSLKIEPTYEMRAIGHFSRKFHFESISNATLWNFEVVKLIFNQYIYLSIYL